jgi:hypothetical protein
MSCKVMEIESRGAGVDSAKVQQSKGLRGDSVV